MGVLGDLARIQLLQSNAAGDLGRDRRSGGRAQEHVRVEQSFGGLGDSLLHAEQETCLPGDSGYTTASEHKCESFSHAYIMTDAGLAPSASAVAEAVGVARTCKECVNERPSAIERRLVSSCPKKGFNVAVVLYIVLTLAIFAVLGIVQKLVERL